MVKFCFNDVLPQTNLSDPHHPLSEAISVNANAKNLAVVKNGSGSGRRRCDIGELYLRVINTVTTEVNDRNELVVYLAERIDALLLEKRERADLPLVEIPGKKLCRVPHVSNRCFHPSLIYFQAETPPTPSLSDYFLRLVKFCEVSGEALFRAMFILCYFRYCYRQVFPISSFTIHRLLATVLLCACKFGEDYPWSNGHFARYALLEIKDLNRMETEFLTLIQFQLFVPNQLLAEFIHQLFLTKPTIKLFHLPFDIATQLVTVKSLHEICFKFPLNPTAPGAPQHHLKSKAAAKLGLTVDPLRSNNIRDKNTLADLLN